MNESKKRLERLERDVRDLGERVRRLEKEENPKKLVGPTVVPM